LLETGRLHERVLTAGDLHATDELAVLSSLRGWRPALLGTGQRRMSGRTVDRSMVGGS